MTAEVNRSQLRDALKLLVDVIQLSRHPLTQLSLIQARIQARPDPGGQTALLNADLKRGQALYDLLYEAILSLKPPTGDETFENKHWRPYLILHHQYVRGMRPVQLSKLWHIDRSTYSHELSRAIDKLGELLVAWEEGRAIVAFSTPLPHPSTTDGAPAENGASDIAPTTESATSPSLSPAPDLVQVPVPTLTYARGSNGHGVNGHGLNGHGLNGHGLNGHGLNGHGLNGHGVNGHGLNGHASDIHTPVERDRLIQQAVQYLTAGNRLEGRACALTGIPGVGKTFLALAVAHHESIQAHFPDGMLWITLERIPDQSMV